MVLLLATRKEFTVKNYPFSDNDQEVEKMYHPENFEDDKEVFGLAAKLWKEKYKHFKKSRYYKEAYERFDDSSDLE